MGGQLPAQALPGLTNLLPTLLSANTFPRCSQLMGDGWSSWEVMEVDGPPGRTLFSARAPGPSRLVLLGPCLGPCPADLDLFITSAFSRAEDDQTFLPA